MSSTTTASTAPATMGSTTTAAAAMGRATPTPTPTAVRSPAAAMAGIMPAAVVIATVSRVAIVAPAVIAKKTNLRPIIVIGRSAVIARSSHTPGERR